nr:hypothetical protein [uncultured Pseudodesulfovibrio sp.]
MSESENEIYIIVRDGESIKLDELEGGTVHVEFQHDSEEQQRNYCACKPSIIEYVVDQSLGVVRGLFYIAVGIILFGWFLTKCS